MYETRHHPLLTKPLYHRRVWRHVFGAAAFIGVSLAVGVVGYHQIEHLAWVDALLNASMILGGMGPVDQLHTSAGKLFASGYALYSGFVALIVAGLVLAPILHRLLHRFHVGDEPEQP